jgi:hypothetical protein
MRRAFLPSANRYRWAVHGNKILQNAAILNCVHRGFEYFVSARGSCSSECAAGGQHSSYSSKRWSLVCFEIYRAVTAAQDNRRSLLHNQTIIIMCRLRRSHWPRGLRRRFAVACLQRLWVRILCLVSVVFYQVEVLRRSDQSSRGILPTVVRRCVSSRNLVNEGALARWGPWPAGGPGQLGAVAPKIRNLWSEIDSQKLYDFSLCQHDAPKGVASLWYDACKNSCIVTLRLFAFTRAETLGRL